MRFTAVLAAALGFAAGIILLLLSALPASKFFSRDLCQLGLAAFGDWVRKEGTLAQEDGSKIKAVSGVETKIYTDTAGTTLYDFLHSHDVDLAEGYTLMPYADSADLSHGTYYFDKAA